MIKNIILIIQKIKLQYMSHKEECALPVFLQKDKGKIIKADAH